MLKTEKFYDKTRLLSRLRERIQIVDNHWLWFGKTTSNGRGVMTVGGVNGKDIEVHRVSAYIHHNLDLKDTNSHALHKNSCPYKHCCSPECIYVGTHADNMNDIRMLPNFRCGHPKLNNSKILTSGNKRCKICHNLMNKNRKLKQNNQKQTDPSI
jgi:hypothetical protein